MNIPLDEVIFFDEVTSHPSTGAATDADSTPTFEVFEEATDTDIGVGGSMTKRTSKTGNYRGTFTASAANGFEVGKWYSIVVSATVNAIAGKKVSKNFRVVAAETTVGGISDILNVVPMIPPLLDMHATPTWRIGLMLTNAVDDLPSTAEITPGTVNIDKKSMGGSGWVAVVADAACSEDAGQIYYDATFSPVSYAEGDSIRITFKNQKITVASNDYEITGSTGRMFYSAIRRDSVSDIFGTVFGVVNYIDTAIVAYHLDHLLAVAYDPAAKPGAADALLNELIGNDAGVSQFTANALELAPTGGSAPSAAVIADAVWDEAIAGHLTAGTTGNKLNAASSAGDPWSTALPGSYAAGTAGYILADTRDQFDDIITDSEMVDSILDGSTVGRTRGTLGGDVVFTSDCQESDRYIDTTAGPPWEEVLIKLGSGTLSTGVRLVEKRLFSTAGANITSTSVVIGQAKQ